MSIKKDHFIGEVTHILDEIQKNLFNRALAFRTAHTVSIDDNKAFNAFFKPDNPETPEIHGGFAESAWCGSEACESKVKEDLGVTIRCIPFDRKADGPMACVCCGRPNGQQVVFAKAY